LRGFGDGTVTIIVLTFEVVRKQFSQILAVIVVVLMDIVQEVNKLIAEETNSDLNICASGKPFSFT